MENIKTKIFGNRKEWENSDDDNFRLIYPCLPIKWLQRQKIFWRWMSLNNKLRLLKCIIGFHESKTLGCCWVCGYRKKNE